MSTQFNFIELIPGLPEELALEILTRLEYKIHKFAASVNWRWRNLIHSQDFYYHRKKNGFTHKSACLIQSQPGRPDLDQKPAKPTQYSISIFDPVNQVWDRVDPVPKYPSGFPLFCHVASTEGKLILLGGWDPTTYEPIKDVFVYDFITRRWTEVAQMPSKRSFFATAAVSGCVYVAGGHDESKNALNSAWVFDIRDNRWTELAKMGEERDECHGFISVSGFSVVSGYGTENQGAFKNSAEVYDFGLGKWATVENAWAANTCPRSNVNYKGQNGKLFPCSDLGEAVQVGTCGVDLGDRVLVSGSGYQGGPHGFYLGDGVKGKLVKLDVPDNFSGFVQTGCCVEI